MPADTAGARRAITMRRNIPILCYHAIDALGYSGRALGHTRALFARHLDLIQALGFTTISASGLLDICAGTRPPDRRYIVLTFDDGHVSHWLDAAPMLAERNMKGVFFTVTDFIRPGRPRTREQAPPPLDVSDAFAQALTGGDCSPFMNESELGALVHDLGMEVFSHTAAHQACFRTLKRVGSLTAQAHWSARGIYPDARAALPVFEHGSAYACNGYWPREPRDGTPAFRRRSDADRRAFCGEDFSRSIERISAINHAARQLLCWPWGEFDPIAEEAARAAGFSGAFTLERTPNGPGTDPFRLGRIRVGRTKGIRWLSVRLRLHATAAGASLLSKPFRKKPEAARVLYVTDSARMSGGGRQLLNNVAAMAEHGVDAVVCAPPGSEISRALDGTGTRVIPWEHPRRLVGSARFLARAAREHRVDVVHAFHSRPAKAAVLSKLLGGSFRLYLNRGVTYRPNPLMGLFAVIADGVICNSHASARVLRAHLTPGRRINVVYNSVAGGLTATHPVEHGGPLRVLWVGNANPVKGYDILRRIACLYAERYPAPSVSFVAYGVDPAAGIARSGSGDRPAPVELHGPASHKAVLQALSEADVFLLTSRRESLPNALLEAFRAALPVVCTGAGGVAEVVRDGVNGWVRPPEDVEALTGRLRDLVEHPERRLAMGALNQRLASACFNNTRKGYLLLRVYSGERVTDTVACDGDSSGPANHA
jgi:glycosyltransferase involved in cell wall biosynthesis/peptidoglycan/xylan/chitin deacetylase (PgdA/CDA1 family)